MEGLFFKVRYAGNVSSGLSTVDRERDVFHGFLGPHYSQSLIPLTF